ncbi:MAG: serine hydrolase domain-containing protein [Acidimicrobiia bacterium]
MTTIQGWTAPGFEVVRDRFEKNFADGLEVGAAFAAYHRGEKVVDLWGGTTDEATGQPWEEDTMIVVFSTTKGATAICANRLAQEGRLDVNAPVAEYWPEFAQAGKADIPVDYLLSHRAGLAWVDEKLTLEEALAWDPMIRALEHQVPVWEPGTVHGYHALTYGYLVGEVVRRITGRTIGTYFREEVAAPLGLDFHIGLPEELEHRVAPLIGNGLGMGDADVSDVDPEALAALMALVGPESKLGKALSGGGSFAGADAFNTRAVHAAEVPAAGGITDARSLARMYAASVSDVDGVRLLTPEQVKDASTQRSVGPDVVILDLDLQWGLGFNVNAGLLQLGGPRSFGHFGMGGSTGWADPEAEIAFGYVMNKMELALAGDLRSYGLVNACYDAIG